MTFKAHAALKIVLKTAETAHASLSLVVVFVCFFPPSTPNTTFSSSSHIPIKTVELQTPAVKNRPACLPRARSVPPRHVLPFEQPQFHSSSPAQLHCSKQTQFVMQDFTFLQCADDILSILINFFALSRVTPEASMHTASF